MAAIKSPVAVGLATELQRRSVPVGALFAPPLINVFKLTLVTSQRSVGVAEFTGGAVVPATHGSQLLTVTVTVAFEVDPSSSVIVYSNVSVPSKSVAGVYVKQFAVGPGTTAPLLGPPQVPVVNVAKASSLSEIAGQISTGVSSGVVCGSATITGTVYRLGDNSYQWNVDVKLVQKRNWADWSAISGRTFKANSNEKIYIS